MALSYSFIVFGIIFHKILRLSELFPKFCVSIWKAHYAFAPYIVWCITILERKIHVNWGFSLLVNSKISVAKNNKCFLLTLILSWSIRRPMQFFLESLKTAFNDCLLIFLIEVYNSVVKMTIYKGGKKFSLHYCEIFFYSL